MSNRVKLWFATLACVVLVGAQLFGYEVDAWHKTGGPGIINLPAACSLSANTGISASHQQLAANRYQAGYKLADISNGLCLRKPSNMGPASLVYSTKGILVGASLVDGDIVISGEDLTTLRDSDVLEIGMTLRSAKGMYLNILIVLEQDESNFIVLVE